ncbi:MAG TPA: cupredoxin domain-containing protein [Polyangiaceae bacterium]|nr:cupredoxin domain-containing protein [Polyangiaceae bacterium]
MRRSALTVKVLLLLVASVALATGCKRSDASPEPSDGRRVVADEHGFTPASLALPKGGPGSKASVTFLRTSDQTCATEVVFPELGIKKELPLQKAVDIDVPTDQGRTLTFQCGMAMYKGALLVK